MTTLFRFLDVPAVIRGRIYLLHFDEPILAPILGVDLSESIAPVFRYSDYLQASLYEGYRNVIQAIA